MRTLTVHDASVLIDLLGTGLADPWFKLGIPTLATDFVVAEVRQPDQALALRRRIDTGCVQVHATAPDQMAGLVASHRALGLSLADTGAIRLAQHQKAVLLCGDARMRARAEAMGLTVCGVLWICDWAIWKGTLSAGDGPAILRQLKESGARLPESECAFRLQKWKNGLKIEPRNPWGGGA